MSTIVLLSGGLDSAVVLAMCEEPLALAFDYGQPHRIELERAEEIAAWYSVDLKLIRLPNLPKINDVVFAGRNLVFAAHAIAIAQQWGCEAIAVGSNSSDWVRFPDCRAPFWGALEKCAEAYNVRVLTPLLHMDKRDIVRTARERNVPIEITWSCYDPQGEEPCRRCLACTTREEALR